MDSRITSLIDLALENGEITAKQREIIHKKAMKLGVSNLEVDTLIDLKLNETNDSFHSFIEEEDAEKSRKLYKRKGDAKISGVCTGLGFYFNINPWFFRYIFILTFFFSFWIYIALSLLISDEDSVSI